ncbi:MAG: hypothetical protein ACOCTT_03665 [archaeon]
MKIDKFGVGSLIIGALIVIGMLDFFFMEEGWGTAGLLNAVVVTIQGGIILLGIFLFVIGVLLLWL